MNHLGYGIKMLLVLAGTVVIVGGCASNEISAKHIDREGIDAVIVDNAAKVTYIKENGHTEKFCAYRDADVESVAANGFSLGVSTGMGSESIGENSGHGALALGGRSPAVLIVRELMYRACELSINSF
jgi:hypothetical protein